MRRKVSIILILIFEACKCMRKLAGGEVTAHKQEFMVYFLQSPKSENIYDSWLCGGALISPQQVLTAAACLTESSHLYVIAGYRRYVNSRAVEYNECTKNRKQRVVKTCVPQNYKFSNVSISEWMTLDVGVATLEKPYNLSDPSWRFQCSYTPKIIRISYGKYESDTDALAFGWGSNRYRLNTDISDHNSLELQEILVKIADKMTCMIVYQPQALQAVIKRYMYCVKDDGNIDSAGHLMDSGYRENDQYRLKHNEEYSAHLRTRRSGAVCQNDHGGPLVTWDGSEKVVIGVACTGVVNNMDNTCISPSLFTSTYCTGKVIACLIAAAGSDARRSCTKDIQSNGISIKDTSIDWGQESEEFENKDSYGD